MLIQTNDGKDEICFPEKSDCTQKGNPKHNFRHFSMNISKIEDL